MDDPPTVKEAELIVAANNVEGNITDEDMAEDLGVDLISAIQKIRKISKLIWSSPQHMEDFKSTSA
ncbi:hypothetical protein FRB93_002470 [Tulasnella sp. JGI-2019a]|nr:hypothetical protein FRB93_002470 [Tulasnella sp. JGI-2019a]